MSDLPRADKEQCGAFIVSVNFAIMSWLLRTIYFNPPNLKLMF